jgi:diguanylate cyclase (GGDEF)-like protein/PAS domain S-box-containing protein
VNAAYALAASPEARVTLGADDRFTGLDERAEQLLGRSSDALAGTPLLAVARAADEPALAELLRQLSPGGPPLRAEVGVLHADGRELLAELTLVRAGDGSVTVYLHDITARRLAEQVAAATQAVTSAMARAESPERAIESLLGSLGSSMGWALGVYWTVAHDGALERVVAWRDQQGSVAEEEVTGEVRLPRERTIAGRALDTGETQWIADLAPHTDLAGAEAVARTGMRSLVAVPLKRGGRPGGVIAFFAAVVRPPDDATIRALTAAADQVAELLEILEERHQLVTSLARLALTDELTGLPNRRAWEEALARELARAARDDHPVCVAVLDLDGFKAFNDEHGHQAGDRVLSEAAQAWQHQLRASDLLARYGGEEFAAVIPAWPLRTAVEVVERLRAATPGGLTASAGVASWNRTETGVELFGRADAALYEAKQAGRNRTIASPESESSPQEAASRTSGEPGPPDD